MIEVNERIEVPSTPKAVWAILSDPSAVVECVEGAALGDKQEDGSYNAKMTDKGEPIMPVIVIVIDELADLMASYGREIGRAHV